MTERLSDLPDHPEWQRIQAEKLDPALYMTPEDIAVLRQLYPEDYPTPSIFEDVTKLLETDITDFTATVHGIRTDGFALMYQGAHVTIYGEPGSGKTMLAKYITAEAISAGHRCLHIDIDGNFGAVLAQDIKAFGTKPADIIELFSLAQPDTAQALHEVIRFAVANPYTIAVIDSVASLQAYTAADGDNATDYVQKVYMAIVKPLLDVGTTVITIDHTAKGDHIKGAAGTIQKRAKADLAFHVIPGAQSFARGRDGIVRLYLDKDRYSSVKAASSEHDGRDLAAIFKIPAAGLHEAKLQLPDGAVTPTVKNDIPKKTGQLILEFLATGKEETRQTIANHLQKSTDATNRALSRLITDGAIYKTSLETFRIAQK